MFVSMNKRNNLAMKANGLLSSLIDSHLSGSRSIRRIVFPCSLFLACFFKQVSVSIGQELITVPVDPFTKLSISNSTKVNLTPGKTYSVTFEGNQEDAQKIRESIKDGELVIKGRPLQKMNIMFSSLEEIEIKGISKVSCDEPIVADHFRIEISGTGEMSIHLIAKKADVAISGAGDLKLSGSSEILNMDISGAGNVSAENFKTKICNADISGSGHCTVDVTDELNSDISGSGSISYKNQPLKVNKDISGIGYSGADDIDIGSGDTTRFTLGNRKIIVVNGNDSVKKMRKDKVQPHWAGLELGFNGYLNSENKSSTDGYDFLELDQWKSIAVNLNFFDYNINLYKRYIMIVSGFGLSFNNYRFKNNYQLHTGGSGVYGVFDSTINFQKNKLTVSYLTVPVLLEFNTSATNRRSFHISAGATFGYKIGSHTKQTYTLDGEKQKVKNFNEFSINPWRVDACGRIGYRNFTVFANYDLISLFRKDKGPEVYPFTVGLTLAGW